VFGTEGAQTESLVFDITWNGTKTKQKQENKIVEISTETIRYPNTVTVMIYCV